MESIFSSKFFGYSGALLCIFAILSPMIRIPVMIENDAGEHLGWERKNQSLCQLSSPFAAIVICSGLVSFFAVYRAKYSWLWITGGAVMLILAYIVIGMHVEWRGFMAVHKQSPARRHAAVAFQWGSMLLLFAGAALLRAAYKSD